MKNIKSMLLLTAGIQIGMLSPVYSTTYNYGQQPGSVPTSYFPTSYAPASYSYSQFSNSFGGISPDSSTYSYGHPIGVPIYSGMQPIYNTGPWNQEGFLRSSTSAPDPAYATPPYVSTQPIDTTLASWLLSSPYPLDPFQSEFVSKTLTDAHKAVPQESDPFDESENDAEFDVDPRLDNKYRKPFTQAAKEGKIVISEAAHFKREEDGNTMFCGENCEYNFDVKYTIDEQRNIETVKIECKGLYELQYLDKVIALTNELLTSAEQSLLSPTSYKPTVDAKCRTTGSFCITGTEHKKASVTTDTFPSVKVATIEFSCQIPASITDQAMAEKVKDIPFPNAYIVINDTTIDGQTRKRFEIRL